MKMHDKLLFILVCLVFLFGTFASNVLSISTPIGEMYVLRISILLAGILFFVSRVSTRKQAIGFSNNKYAVFWFFLLFYSLFQLLWVKEFFEWFKSFFIFFEVFLFFTIFPSVLNTKKRLIICLYLLEISIIVQMIIGGYEAFTGDYLIQTKYIDSYFRLQSLSSTGFYTPVAMMYNPNDYATALIVGACVATILFHQSKRLLVKLLHLVVLLACAPLIYCSDSRACLIAYGLIIVLYVLLFVKKRWIKLLSLVALIIVGLIVVPRLETFFYDANIAESDEIRLSLIFDGFYFLLSTFFMGVGFGQVSWWYSNNHYFSQGIVLIPHNWWIEAMMTFGLIFFLIYLWLYFYELRCLVLFAKKGGNNREKALFKGFILFLIVFVAVSISSSSLFKTEYIWAFFALINSFILYFSKKAKKGNVLLDKTTRRADETFCTNL